MCQFSDPFSLRVIPSKFMDEFGDEMKGVAKFKVLNHRTWQVRVAKAGAYFGEVLVFL